MIVDSEHFGGVSLYVDDGWPDVAGPDCMKGVSVAVWDAAHKHIEKLTQPIVLLAIGHVQMGDDLTRRRGCDRDAAAAR